MDAFEALADPVRRDLLVAVSRGPMRVVDLAAAQRITRPAVSRHLRLLTDAGLLTVQDRGRERHYLLQPRGLQTVRSLLDRLQYNETQPTSDQESTRRRQAAPLSAGALAALDTEVRRTARTRRTAPAPAARKDTA